jgi:DNA-binding transcriptional ArsR family regulator
VNGFDDEHLRHLANRLRPLGNATRLRLLRELHQPQTLSEIEVHKPENDRDKPLARQTVKDHLVRLVETEAVISREAQREYGETTEYMLNNQQVSALAEELRDLSRLTPTEDPTDDTVQREPRLGEIETTGPHLVLAKGVPEGRIFELGDDRDRWTIGRKRGLAVALPSDPFVSAENALVERDSHGHAVRNLPQSRNGTIVNGQELDGDARHALEPGDLIRVGKSTLIYRS